jgi:hypothetical protein
MGSSLDRFDHRASWSKLSSLWIKYTKEIPKDLLFA